MDFVTRIFKDDKFHILTYLDVCKALSDAELDDFIQPIVKRNPILRQRFIHGHHLINDEHFDLKQHYIVKKTNKLNRTASLLNAPCKTWFLSAYVDEANLKTRIYFKINHAYADGYQLLKILSSPFVDEQPTAKFKRYTHNWIDKLYYLTVGTMLLLVTLVRCLMNRPKQEPSELKGTDFITVNGIELSTIKAYAKQHKVTVNDVMYTLAIKAHKLYVGDDKFYTVCPINITQTQRTNNVCPLILSVDQSDEQTILKKVHNAFNCAKYSLFVPMLSSVLQTFADVASDYVFDAVYNYVAAGPLLIVTNVIGPDLSGVAYADTMAANITNVPFFATTTNEHICFNLISCREKMNVNVTFVEGVIADKRRYAECITNVYKSMI